MKTLDYYSPMVVWLVFSPSAEHHLKVLPNFKKR